MVAGDMQDRDDGGNLWILPGSHNRLAKAFAAAGLGSIPWCPHVVDRYLRRENLPIMHAVRRFSGQAFLMHHHTEHASGPSCSDLGRICVHFRITAKPLAGCIKSYPDAMKNTILETPLLLELASVQFQKTPNWEETAFELCEDPELWRRLTPYRLTNLKPARRAPGETVAADNVQRSVRG